VDAGTALDEWFDGSRVESPNREARLDLGEVIEMNSRD